MDRHYGQARCGARRGSLVYSGIRQIIINGSVAEFEALGGEKVF